MSELLLVQGVRAGYGKVTVLHDIDLSIETRSIAAIIGHNGAGKSSLLHTIFGLIPWSRGKVVFEGRDIGREDPARRLGLGMCLIPQGVNVFGQLTGWEHFRLVGYKDDKEVDAVLELFPELGNKVSRPAQSLSGGERQMLAIACGVLRRPTLMLIDEPSTGLAPVVVNRVMTSLSRMRDDYNMTVVVVEQNVSAVLEVCDFVHAMRAGRVIYSDSVKNTRSLDPSILWKLL